MKIQFGKLVQRLKQNQRTRTNRRKKLRLESLEDRRLLAVAVMNSEFAHHNDVIATDVNGDYHVSAIDALLVINALNNNQGGALPEIASGKAELMLDTSADNFLTPLDALTVINQINSGEGEPGDPAEFTHAFVDTSGAPITSNTVSVGDIFQLQIFVQDRRGFSAEGINAAYLDIDYDNGDVFDVAVGEIQTIKFFFDKLDTAATDSSFTLSLGSETTAPIALFTAGGSPRSDTAIAMAIQDALAALPSVGTGNVTAIVDQIATAEDSENNTPRFNFEVRFGNQLQGQDLPLLVMDATNVGVVPGATFDFEIAEVLAGNQSTPEAEAAAVIFADLYNFSRDAVVTPTQFDEIGATSQTLPLPDKTEKKLVFSIPMVAKMPGTVTFTPNPAEESPLHDIIANVTVIPTSEVDYNDPFTLTVVSDPTAPVAINDTLSLEEDTSLSLNGNVTLNDTVTSPRTLSVASVSSLPGTVGTFNGLTYTPPQDYVGQDTFTYVAEDSSGLQSNSATVTINVTPVNDPPVAGDDLSLMVDEDSTDNILDVLINDSVGPSNETSDTISITAVGSTNNGGTVSITGGGGSLTYTPMGGFLGTETFTYTITDSGGLTDTATVSVLVEPGVLPRARPNSASGAENTSINVDVLSDDSVNPGSTPTLVSVNDGSFGTVVAENDGTVTYTPSDADFYGTDTFTYTMNDSSGLGVDSTGTVTITVTDVNDTPMLMDDTATGTEDNTLNIAISSLLSNDSPGAGESASEAQNPQTLTITSVSALTTNGGSVMINGSDITYTPATDYNGTFEFTYTAIDDGTTPSALSSTATVTITVDPVNDAPIATGDSASVNEDHSLDLLVTDLLSNDANGPATATDESTQTLTVTSVDSMSQNGATVSLSGGTITYSPPADFFGTDTFTYTITDDGSPAESDSALITITVQPINDAPISGIDDAATAFKDAPLTINVRELLDNDSTGPANESDQTLSVVSVDSSSSQGGSISFNSDGTFTYTPPGGFTGSDTFTYTIQDSGASGGLNMNQTTGTVNLNVENFIPTDISGFVFVDETGDGVMNGNERALGGVWVTLHGMSLGQTVPEQRMLTLSDGSYSFDNLGPGQYIVNYDVPHFFADGADIPGMLGDSDTVANQFTIDVAEPGGKDGSGYNFAVQGLTGPQARIIDQLASRYIIMNPSLAYNGAYFGLGADNSLLWSATLDGFDDTLFAEAVLSDSGAELLITKVDGNHDVFTAKLGRGEFIRTTDDAGNSVVRVLGDQSQFVWQQVNLATPPVTSFHGYLDSVDEVFAQEEWDR